MKPRMTLHHPEHAARIAAGVGYEWDCLPPVAQDITAVDPAATQLRLRRIGKYRPGLARLPGLTHLWAYGVDAAFLDEIARLPGLHTLHMEDVGTADLAPLAALPALERLTVIGATKVPDLGWTRDLRGLRVLGLEHFKRVDDLSPLAERTQLTALAVEGSLWSAMRVATLEPLASLQALESLFLTNLRVADRSLRPLQALPRLRVLQCARFFPVPEFEALAAASPALECSWFPRLGVRAGAP
jgi:hypothetical protein